MINNRRFFKVVFFIVAVILAILAGYYREVNDGERVWLKNNISQDSEKNIIVDLAKQGFLKYYLQPGQISIYIRNIGVEDTDLRVCMSGITGYISQGSKKSNWQEVKPEHILKKRKNGILPINIELNIPYENTRRYEVGTAALNIFNERTLLQTIHIKIINSSYSS